LLIDSATGAITLDNYANEIIAYAYKVKVTNTGSLSPLSDDWTPYDSGTGLYELNTASVSDSSLEISTGFSLSTQCGSSSTTVSLTASPIAGK
jgi:hypothetical protein